MYSYVLYGVSLRSEWPLPCHERADPALPVVELVEQPPGFFATAACEADRRLAGATWAGYIPLSDGTDYLRWADLFEFLVAADGRRIAGRPLRATASGAFQTYLLGQVLSHALIKLGFEPLHATVVEANGAAVGLMGDTGRGKSTLAASFLASGHRLLTDDLLVVRQTDQGLLACPGIPRLKLFPDVAEALVGDLSAASPMNPLTSKLVIPLDEWATVTVPLPLRAVYVLATLDPRSRSGGPRIRRLPPRQAFVELVRNTYNRDVTDTGRLRRQLALDAALVASVGVKRLSFPGTCPGFPPFAPPCSPTCATACPPAAPCLEAGHDLLRTGIGIHSTDDADGGVATTASTATAR